MSHGKSNICAMPDGPGWHCLDLPQASVQLYRGWIEPAQAQELAACLRAQLPWSVHHIRLFGRSVPSPRLSCWIGDQGATYRYSGSRFEPQPWIGPLQALRGRLQRELGADFNSVLANLYRDGRDAMGWHADDEPELGPRPLIASISLGASRRFLLRRRDDHRVRLAIDLQPGSLLLMGGQTQHDWQHALPRTARPVGERINLTFRRIQAAGRD
jgi:alkylated DNA repair dioxygenase AlkB